MKVAKYRMNHAPVSLIAPLALFIVGALPMMASDPSPGARQIFDKKLSATERDVPGIGGDDAGEQIRLRPYRRRLQERQNFWSPGPAHCVLLE